MHKAGVISIWFGIFLTVVGLFAGFPLMFLDYDDLAVQFLTAVPFGFVITFSGIVATLLGRPD